MVRELASHKYGPGSTPGVDAIYGLSLVLVLSLAPRGFSPGTPVFPSRQKLTLPNSNSIWNARTRLNEFICASWVNKEFIIIIIFLQCRGRRGFKTYTFDKLKEELRGYAYNYPILSTQEIIDWAKACHFNLSVHAYDARYKTFAQYIANATREIYH